MVKYTINIDKSRLESLPKSEIEDFFPISSHSPQEVFANKARTTFFSISHTNEILEPNKLQEYKERVFDVVYKSDKIHVITSQIGKIKGRECIIIENVILGEDAQKGTYQMLLATSIENRMFLASFTGPEAELESLAPAARQIIKSIEVKL